MNVLVIGNPVAGRGHAAEAMETLARCLEGRGHHVEVFFTADRGDAGRRAASVGPDFDRIVVAGGDGTLNEVVNGLEDPGRVPLLPLPLGTANVIAREHKLPREPEAIADLVDRGAIRRVDLGTVGGRRFLALASAGFDAAVIRTIGRNRRGALGFRGYVLPVLRTAASYPSPRLQVRVDGGEAVAGALAVVGKTRNYGGIFRVTDRAVCDSGGLDVCVLRRSSLPALALYGVAALTGRLSVCPGVVYLTGQRVVIEARPPAPVQVDGDPLGETPVEISVLPGALALVVPRSH